MATSNTSSSSLTQTTTPSRNLSVVLDSKKVPLYRDSARVLTFRDSTAACDCFGLYFDYQFGRNKKYGFYPLQITYKGEGRQLPMNVSVVFPLVYHTLEMNPAYSESDKPYAKIVPLTYPDNMENMAQCVLLQLEEEKYLLDLYNAFVSQLFHSRCSVDNSPEAFRKYIPSTLQDIKIKFPNPPKGQTQFDFEKYMKNVNAEKRIGITVRGGWVMDPPQSQRVEEMTLLLGVTWALHPFPVWPLKAPLYSRSSPHKRKVAVEEITPPPLVERVDESTLVPEVLAIQEPL